jgi:hypothetical protein
MSKRQKPKDRHWMYPLKPTGTNMRTSWLVSNQKLTRQGVVQRNLSIKI